MYLQENRITYLNRITYRYVSHKTTYRLTGITLPKQLDTPPLCLTEHRDNTYYVG